ncbi:hypothetical protein THAOC_24118 [Thalassiosira oceanica]|uniref:RING-type domain-containing protein n=1 Tax=Thalassiosira oceanica TaxID=159749 RepID=K0RQL5_THAOC|nr:hypothetical protein THAOC_24118 [Thalassiosira oceanica]|eukprot:EJK56063.1 hypothetical protein THAOC_24118 [Thalassiosira oceanica]
MPAKFVKSSGYPKLTTRTLSDSASSSNTTLHFHSLPRTRTETATRKRSITSDDMKICGACVRELPDGSYSAEQRRLRQSIRRCEECVAAGNRLVLMKKGRTRSEADDCPICQLPLPLDVNEWMFKPCCMKLVCDGCTFAARKRGMWDCPFCRTPTPDKEQALAMIQKRADKGDPVAMYNLGTKYHFGQYGLVKDVTRAVELYERAAELGEVEKDMAKAIRHYEAAAMGGDHMMMSVKLGDDDSLGNVKRLFMAGLATKDDYASALRGHQSAIEEMSSPDRAEAKEFGSEKIQLV